MHIAHVNFAKGFRGGERQTLNLIQGLAKLGCKQTLICRPGGDLMRRVQKDVVIDILSTPNPLLGHLRMPRFDLIHVHEARGAYWAWLEYCLRGTPYLITRRVINPISSSWITRKVYGHAARLVGVSSEAARRLAMQAGCKVDVVLDSCAPLQACGDTVQEVRGRIGGAPVIGHVGVLHDEVKGQATLIAAFKELVVKWPKSRLVFVGEGADRAQLEALAGNDERIMFAGQQQDVAAWIAAMDVFAFPSHVEALGSSVLDAMMLGVPVVASKAGGLPELTGKDERGLSVAGHSPEEWNSAIQRMLDDEVLRIRLVAAGRIFAQSTNIEAHANRYLSIYENVIRTGGAE